MGEEDTFGISGSFGAPKKKKKKFSNNFSIKKTKFCLILHYNDDSSSFVINRKKSISLKQIIKMSTFHPYFVWEACLKKFDAEEVSLKGNMYDFSVDYNVINKSDILNIRKYLMVKNNIKCFVILNKFLLHYWVLVDF